MATYSHTWSDTALGPFNGTQFGSGDAMTVSGGVASVYSGGAPDGTKLTGHTYSTVMAGNRHYAQATYYIRQATFAPRGAGVFVGGNAAVPTTGVFCSIATWSASDALRICTLDDGANFTDRVTANVTATTGDLIKIEVTHNGSNYVYTVYKNGSSVSSWSDTGGIVTPGNYVGVVYIGNRNSNTWWFPQGSTAFEANDDASVPPASSFTAISSITGVTSITV